MPLFAEVRSAQRSLQGAASGYDIAAQLVGGYVEFVASGAARMARVDPPSSVDLNWVVAWSGRKADTGDMIRDVATRFAPGHPVYAEIGALAQRGARHLRDGDVHALGRDLTAGQSLLATLGAVPADLATRIDRLQQHPSVLGARLSGAGGGDCVLVLATAAAEAAAACEREGFDVLPLSVEQRGLCQEQVR